ncbi:MAG: methyltransferase domain-containing protein [Acidobacteriaceae bacterium]|nr:methyltransferase domain-containing protein [Acidobacteriaceae bacterium]
MERLRTYAWDMYLFMRSWFSSPKQMGEIMPSSSKTGKKIADLIKDVENVLVVELGAGTGQITEKIVEGGVQPDKFVTVELDPRFCKELRKRFPMVKSILNIDAADILKHLPSKFVGKTDYLISTLPLLMLGNDKAKAIVDAIFKTLKPNGVYIQVTLSPFQPKYIEELGLKATKLCVSWLNLPPMHVWRICRAT